MKTSDRPTPPGFQRIRRLLESRMGNRGKKEFIQILRRMEVFEEAKLIDREPRLVETALNCLSASLERVILPRRHGSQDRHD